MNQAGRLPFIHLAAQPLNIHFNQIGERIERFIPDVFGNFVVQGINAGGPLGYGISVLCFIFVAGINALELLVGAIQAYVFALLTSLYINDAVNLH